MISTALLINNVGNAVIDALKAGQFSCSRNGCNKRLMDSETIRVMWQRVSTQVSPYPWKIALGHPTPSTV